VFQFLLRTDSLYIIESGKSELCREMANMVIRYILSSLIIGFTISYLIQGKAIKLGKKNPFFCRSDQRNFQKSPRPRMGGIGVFFGFLTGGFLFYLLYQLGRASVEPKIGLVECFLYLFSLLMIFFIGFLDDLTALNAWQKLPFEIFASTILFFNGFSIRLISLPFPPGEIELPGPVAYGVTVLWVVVITNAMNLIDGIDGLAGSVAFLALLSFSFISFLNGKPEFTIMSAGMIGAVSAFLVFNFFPARIYLGDSGSLLLGFFLATISLKSSAKAPFGISFVFPITVLFLPILDTTLAFLRRILRGKNPFCADNEHIHHKLMQKGFHEKKVFAILVLAMVFFSTLGTLSMLMTKIARLFILIFALLVGTFIVFYLEYIGLHLLKRKIHKPK